MKRRSKFAAYALGLLILAGAVGAVAFRQNAVARLRSEQQVLASENQEARRLAEENQGIAGLRAENAEVVKLREENKDLPRLRNEVRQLRRDAGESAKLRADNERLQAAINAGGATAPRELPADFIARSAMSDVGLATPEAAAQTFWWAMCQGNLERLSQATLKGAINTYSDPEWGRKQLIEQMKNFPGFRIVKKEELSPDEVQLNLGPSTDDSSFCMKFKKVGDEWKLKSLGN